MYRVLGVLRREPVSSGWGWGCFTEKGMWSHTLEALGDFSHQSKEGGVSRQRSLHVCAKAQRQEELLVCAVVGGVEGRKVGRALFADLKSVVLSLWEPWKVLREGSHKSGSAF